MLNKLTSCIILGQQVDIKEACLNTQVLEEILETTDLTHSDSDLNLSMMRDSDTFSTKSA